MALLLVAITISLSSYRMQEPPAFIPPAVIRESLPDPLDFVIPDEYRSLVEHWAAKEGVPVWIAARLFSVESTGDPLSGRWNRFAVSWMGAEGLAQLMPETRQYLEVRYNRGRPIDPFDPPQAIRFGLTYLADLYELTGSWQTAVRSYNGGSGHWSNPRRYGDWNDESVTYSIRVVGR